MAEILVSDFCEKRARAPATAAGRLHLRHKEKPTILGRRRAKNEKPDSL